MTWRLILAAAAVLGLAACDAQGAKSGAHSVAAPGYTLDVFARDNEQIYLVSDAQSHVAAARVVDHVSSLIAADDARALLAQRQEMFHAPREGGVNIQAGGFSMKIDGEGDTDSKEGGNAHIDINAGGHGITIDAQGDSGDSSRARVHISGADQDTARKFISEADDLSADVKAQMLHTLGL